MDLQPPVIAPDLSGLRRAYGVEGKKVVSYVGKLSLGKGTYVLAEAAEIVSAQMSDVSFLLAGKGSVSVRPTRADMRLLRIVPHEEMPALYSIADVAVHPPVFPEPLPQNLLDAASFGKPAVASAVGGIREVVRDGETGILVPRNNPEALGKALIILLQDESLRVRCGRRAQSFIHERFDTDRIVEGLLEFCREAGRH